MNTIDYLKKVSFFSCLPDTVLPELAVKVKEKAFPDSTPFIKEGETGRELYIIKRGEVEIIKGYDQPGEQVIARRVMGDIVGEMALLEDAPRFATVVSRGEVKVLVVAFQDFFRVVGGNPTALRQLLRIVSIKLRQSQENRYLDLKRRNKELSELSSLQQAFLSVVRHELLTPVSNIQLSLEILKRSGAIDAATTEIQQQVGTIERNVGLADQRMRMLVEYATLIGSQGEMFLQLTNFTEVVHQAVTKFRRQAKEANISLTLEGGGEYIWLAADRKRMVEVLGYLLDNAIRFNKPGGAVTITTQQDASRVQCELVDTGIGIPADDLSRLWEPFAQMSSALNRGVEGLGLGLALTRYIIKAHGGEVWVKSVEGQGSQFGFSLPLKVDN